MSTILTLQILLLLSAAIAIGLGFATVSSHNSPGAKYFITLMFGVAWWSILDGISPFFKDVRSQTILAQISYVGIVVTPAAWYSFVSQYSNLSSKTHTYIRRSIFILGGLILIGALTNDLHHELYRGVSISEGDYGPTFEYGYLFWIWVSTSYVLLLSATILLIRATIDTSSQFRSQNLLLIIGAFLPWLGNIAYLTGLNPIVGFDPTPVAFVGVGIVGVTAIFRKRIFDVLPVAYTTLFNKMTDAAVLVSHELRLIDSNKAAQNFIGADDWRGAHIDKYIGNLPKNEIEQIYDFLMDALVSENGARQIFKLTLSENEIMHVSFSASPIRQREQDNASLLITLRDVTETQEFQQQIFRNSQELTEVNHIAKMLLLPGSWENKMVKILRRTKETFGMDHSFLWDVEDNDIHVRSQTSILETSEILQVLKKIEFDKISRENREKVERGKHLEISLPEHQLSLVIYPFQHDQKTWALWTHVWKKRLPHESSLTALGVLSDLLNASIVREDLYNEALMAKEEAIKASAAKSEFLSMMSHEIRTPLNAIVGITHIIDQNEKSEKFDEQVETLQNSTHHLKSLLDDLLDFSKIEAGYVELNEEQISLRSFIQPILNSYKTWASEKGNDLELDIPDEDIYFEADPIRLSQIINNLVNNAIKFTDNGTITLSVSKQGEGDLNFKVRDEGLGISQEDLQNIFNKFTQVNMTNSREYSGTGLGLTISQQLLRIMGAELNVLSTLGEGSTFYFTLHDVVSNTEQKPVEKVSNGNEPLSGKILLVEDNTINMKIASTLIGRWGLQVEGAIDGEEAVRKFKAGTYDLILMDLQMPVMDGYEATRLIREENTDIPILALTASAMIDTAERALEVGMNDFVSKPFKPEELKAKISQFLTKV